VPSHYGNAGDMDHTSCICVDVDVLAYVRFALVAAVVHRMLWNIVCSKMKPISEHGNNAVRPWQASCRSLGETASAVRNVDKSGTNQSCCFATATTTSYHPQVGKRTDKKPPFNGMGTSRTQTKLARPKREAAQQQKDLCFPGNCGVHYCQGVRPHRGSMLVTLRAVLTRVLPAPIERNDVDHDFRSPFAALRGTAFRWFPAGPVTNYKRPFGQARPPGRPLREIFRKLNPLAGAGAFVSRRPKPATCTADLASST
jgi:hypothetical protein